MRPGTDRAHHHVQAIQRPVRPTLETADESSSQSRSRSAEPDEVCSARRCRNDRVDSAHTRGPGNYKILRRLVPWTAEPCSATDRIGMIIAETTGLDITSNEVLEIAAIKFGYADDRITSITDTFQAFQQPSAPIEPTITALTGITDAMVEGRHVDSAALAQFVADSNIVIAHSAAFDRKVAERQWPLFANCHWACSATGIDWKAHGLGGARLTYAGSAPSAGTAQECLPRERRRAPRVSSRDSVRCRRPRCG